MGLSNANFSQIGKKPDWGTCIWNITIRRVHIMVLDAFTKELIEIMDIYTVSQFIQLVSCLWSWSSSEILFLDCFTPASMSDWSLHLLHSLMWFKLTYWYKLPYMIFQRGLSILFQIFSDSLLISQFSLIKIVSGPGSS